MTVRLTARFCVCTAAPKDPCKGGEPPSPPPTLRLGWTRTFSVTTATWACGNTHRLAGRGRKEVAPTAPARRVLQLGNAWGVFGCLAQRQSQGLFNSLFKVLFGFHSQYLFAIRVTPAFRLASDTRGGGGVITPPWSVRSNRPSSARASHCAPVPLGGRRTITFVGPAFQRGLPPADAPVLRRPWFLPMTVGTGGPTCRAESIGALFTRRYWGHLG